MEETELLNECIDEVWKMKTEIRIIIKELKKSAGDCNIELLINDLQDLL